MNKYQLTLHLLAVEETNNADVTVSNELVECLSTLEVLG